MPIFHARRLVFVHVPKTAGTSVCRALAPDDFPRERPGVVDGGFFFSTDVDATRAAYGFDHTLQHCTYAELATRPELAGYRFFAVVRDPFDRALSDAFWCGLVEPASPAAFAALGHAQRYAAVLAGLRRYLAHPPGALDNHRRSQVDFLRDPATGRVAEAVKVVRAEADLAAQLAELVGGPVADMPIEHANARAPRGYGEYRYGELLDAVREAFAEDFAALGYPVQRDRVEVVVARCCEDVAWTRTLDVPGKDVVVHVYDKGDPAEAPPPPGCVHRRLENVGREGDTFLRHVIGNHERYAAAARAGARTFVVFLQGRVADHLPRGVASERDLVASLVADADADGVASLASAVDHPLCREHAARATFTIREWRGARVERVGPHGTLGAWCEARLGHAWPERPRWWAHGIFCVAAAAVARRPAGQYAAMLDDLAHVNPLAGHFLERAWAYVFNALPPKTGPLKVVCTTSDNYEPLFAAFTASLAPLLKDGSVELSLQRLELGGAFEAFGFGHESWRHAILEKLRHALRVLHEDAEHDERVVVSDVDIQFLRPAGLHELVAHARDRGLDYYGMAEGGLRDSYNGGFYVLRNCRAVRALLADVLDRASRERNTYADQEVLNELLRENRHGLRHAAIDPRRCVWGPGRPRAESVFHHAVCVGDIAGKLRQMDAVRARAAR